MKNYIIYILILCPIFSFCQSQKNIESIIKLNYTPKGKIIKFHFNNSTIYTDSISIFYIFSKEYKSNEFSDITNDYPRSLIIHDMNLSENDTIIYSDDSISFKNTLFEWGILHLLTEKRILIYDINNSYVKYISIKLKETKYENYNRVIYRNRKNKKILFEEKIYRGSSGHPRL